MKMQTVWVGIIALATGLFTGAALMHSVAVSAVNSNNIGLMGDLGMDTRKIKQHALSHESMPTLDMSHELINKTGDEFDKEFLKMMTDHHEEAIEMTNLVSERAKHDEIKQFSESILITQTDEIAKMQKWQNDWGY